MSQIITVAEGSLSYENPDGTTGVINLSKEVSVDTIVSYVTLQPSDTNSALIVAPPGLSPNYVVRLSLFDQTLLDIFMGDVDNQPTWTNDLAGAQTAVIDIDQTGAPVPTPALYGYNAVNSMIFYQTPGFVASILSLTLDVQREVGGTLANYSHTAVGVGYGLNSNTQAVIDTMPVSISAMMPNDALQPANYLPQIVTMAQQVGAPVIWCANLFSGTTADCTTAVQALLDGGVEVVGIELGNEGYLTRYIGTYTTAQVYLDQAKSFRDTFKAAFPTIPCGLVIAPSPAMKDPNGGAANPRLDAWNTLMLAQTWPDAFILHSYTALTAPINTPQAITDCNLHIQAVADYVSIIPKDVWITEWNVDAVDSDGTGTGGSDTQVYNYTAMRNYMRTEPKITIACCHSLASSALQYNAIRLFGGVFNLTPMGLAAQAYTP